MISYGYNDTKYTLPSDSPWTLVEVEADYTGQPIHHYVYVYDGAGNLTTYIDKILQGTVAHTPLTETYKFNEYRYNSTDIITVRRAVTLEPVAFTQTDVDNDYDLYFAPPASGDLEAVASGTASAEASINATKSFEAILESTATIDALLGIITPCEASAIGEATLSGNLGKETNFPASSLSSQATAEASITCIRGISATATSSSEAQLDTYDWSADCYAEAVAQAALSITKQYEALATSEAQAVANLQRIQPFESTLQSEAQIAANLQILRGISGESIGSATAVLGESSIIAMLEATVSGTSSIIATIRNLDSSFADGKGTSRAAAFLFTDKDIHLASAKEFVFTSKVMPNVTLKSEFIGFV